MNTCKNCKHWIPPHREEWETLIGKQVGRWGAGTCEELGYYDNLPYWVEGNPEPEIVSNKAGATCCDEHGLRFNCGPDFGCIHFKPKDK